MELLSFVFCVSFCAAVNHYWLISALCHPAVLQLPPAPWHPAASFTLPHSHLGFTNHRLYWITRISRTPVCVLSLLHVGPTTSQLHFTPESRDSMRDHTGAVFPAGCHSANHQAATAAADNVTQMMVLLPVPCREWGKRSWLCFYASCVCQRWRRKSPRKFPAARKASNSWSHSAKN